MSDSLKHECGVALLRLRKDVGYYRERFGATDFGGVKLSLLLEKQHNRGQDGAGASVMRLDPEPGKPAYDVMKSIAANPLTDLLAQIAKRKVGSETLFLGHLRYATFGKGDVAFCHPFVHKSSCLNRTLLMAGNFNLTNNDELFEYYKSLGHHPDHLADGYLITQIVAHRLGQMLDSGDAYDIAKVLREALSRMDGAYTLCGMTADGWSFAIRDPHGIRPGYYYANEDVIAVASERPAIQAAFDCSVDDVKPLPPGMALVIDPAGGYELKECLPPQEKRSCVFERIYFSRANDHLIHAERKALGAALADRVIDAAGTDLENIFLSYIPNSAQVCFHGLLERLFHLGLKLGKDVRFGQVAVKDAKFRTFIADAAARKEFYKHVYDVTYGLVKPYEDTLVVVDDSIVRGNTMKNAILPMLDRLHPRQIVVASSAPPICYPDCYGIDMSTLGELVAFRALVNLLGDSATDTLWRALESADSDPLASLYGRFTEQELSREIARLLTPPGLKAEVKVVFQTVPDLHKACPLNSGDWYFTGNYPTPGGYRVLRKALRNYLEHRSERSY